MKKVVLAQWYNTNNRIECGYYLEGIRTEKIYFLGPDKESCLKYAAENNLKIAYEA